MNFIKVTKIVFSWFVQLLLIIVVTLLINVFVIQTYDINNVSMEPTFDRQGNRVLVYSTPYYFKATPDYGDIVIVDSRIDRKRVLWDRLIGSSLLALVIRESGEHMWIKRVIGLPGDTLEYADSKVYRNGQELVEPYVMNRKTTAFRTTTIPEDHIFVMGDNRSRSIDSRVIGPVPIDNLQGKVVMRFIPLNKISFY